MKSKIALAFDKCRKAKRPALITYTVAGDNTKNNSLEILKKISKHADILELGIAFSDPMAEGPTIQRAHERALEKNTTLEDALGLVKEFRKSDNLTPIVLMGYMNPFEAMGAEIFCEKANKNGVDGILLVDMPLEESSQFTQSAKEFNIDIIRLIAPTTTKNRIEKICNNASGYVYYISVKGITGSSSLDSLDVKDKVNSLKSKTDTPVVIGFGIKDRSTILLVKDLADGIVVGSALVDLISGGTEDVIERISVKMKELVGALEE